MNELLASDPAAAECTAPRALCGWSPPARPAATALERAVDRFLPLTGLPVVAYFALVACLLLAAPLIPRRGELLLDAAAALAGALWCGLNFWRCRHAHCVVDAAGWSALGVLAVGEAVIGRSLIHGDEQLVFLGVLALGLLFEGGWFALRGSNAVSLR
jgi:hypothetical protein